MSANHSKPADIADRQAATGASPAPAAFSRRAALAAAATLGGTGMFGAGAAAQAGGATSDQQLAIEGLGTVWWVELVAADDTKSAAFYNAAVGWTSKRLEGAGNQKAPRPEEPAYTLFMASGNDVAGATRADPGDPVKRLPMWIVYFQVDNVEMAIMRATAHGGRVLISPYDVPGAARMALLADIDGVPFGVATPL